MEDTGAPCPKCDGTIVAKKSKKGRKFYGCSRYPDCDFVTWSEPSKERCPRCGKALFKKKGRNAGLYCLTEGCGYETDGTGAPVEAEKSGKAETPVEKGE